MTDKLLLARIVQQRHRQLATQLRVCSKLTFPLVGHGEPQLKHLQLLVVLLTVPLCYGSMGHSTIIGF